MSENDQYPSGGSITEMADSGTTVPADSAVPRTIRSVPNPSQDIQTQDPSYNNAASLTDAATNATDIPRTVGDTGVGSGVETASGDQVDASVNTKRLTTSANDGDFAKGSLRMEKHARQKGSDNERMASDGPGVDAAPGEEQVDQDELRARRDGQQ